MGIIIAVDPGKSGALATIETKKGGQLKVFNCPQDNDPIKMANIVKKAIGRHKKVDVIMENVWAFPGDSSSSAFKFGTNYGIWQGIFGVHNLSYQKVTPQTWQKAYAPLSKIKKERKNELKEIAKSFYKKATLKNADAVLIAMWGANNV